MHARGDTGFGRRRRALRAVLLCSVACCGLLLWARLKLVTQTPRMVYAEPENGASIEPKGRAADQ